MIKRFCLVGSSFSALPLAEKIIKFGYKLYVVGNKRNDPCHNLANKSFFLDYSDLEKTRKLEDINFDFIVPSSNDIAYKFAEKLSKERSIEPLASRIACDLIHEKDQFRNLLKNHGLPSPKILSKENLEEIFKFGGKVIIKPISSFSGKGISILSSMEKINEAIFHAKKYCKKGKYLIETYFSGSLHSVSLFFKDGYRYAANYADEFCLEYPFAVDTSFSPSRIPTKNKQLILNQLNSFAKSISYNNGMLHIQFIFDGKSHQFIEGMMRCPGDMYPYMIENSIKNYDFTTYYLNSFCNFLFPFNKQKGKSKANYSYIGRKTICFSQQVCFKSFQNICDKNIEIFPLAKTGDLIKEAPYDKLGIVFFKANSYRSLKNFLNKSNSEWIKF